MGDRPAIEEEVAAFVEGGDVAIWVAAAGVELVPQTARSMGAQVDRARGLLRLFLPSEQGARLLGCARVGATLAATFVRIHDYHAVQAKGAIATVRACDEDERGRPLAYRAAFAVASLRVGMPREVIDRLACWPCTVIEVRVAELYAQTPGPSAGARL